MGGQSRGQKLYTGYFKRTEKNADNWGNEYGYHFSVYSTPSSLTDRFCRLDTEKFGIVENITDKEYYTNSFHYDVRKNPTPFEKLDFEKDYQNTVLVVLSTTVNTHVTAKSQST